MDRIFRIKNNGAVDDKYFVLELREYGQRKTGTVYGEKMSDKK